MVKPGQQKTVGMWGKECEEFSKLRTFGNPRLPGNSHISALSMYNIRNAPREKGQHVKPECWQNAESQRTFASQFQNIAHALNQHLYADFFHMVTQMGTKNVPLVGPIRREVASES